MDAIGLRGPAAVKLHGKNWNGEWEPAAASWFKTANGWRLAYGEPLPDVPLGGLTPEWTELWLTKTESYEICNDGQTEDQFKCRYASQYDKPYCWGGCALYDSLGNQAGSFYHQRTYNDIPNPFKLDCSGVTWETVGTIRETGPSFISLTDFTWESRGVDGLWLQRGTIRQGGCFAPKFLQLTEQNPALDGVQKKIEYLEYNWNCPMTKEVKDAPYTEDPDQLYKKR